MYELMIDNLPGVDNQPDAMTRVELKETARLRAEGLKNDRGTGEGDKSQGQGQRDKFCDSRRFHREYLSVPAACTTAGCWWC